MQKGIGYVKLLTIANQLTDETEIEFEELEQIELTEELMDACYRAFQDDQLDRMVQQIEQQCDVISFFDEAYPEKTTSNLSTTYGIVYPRRYFFTAKRNHYNCWLTAIRLSIVKMLLIAWYLILCNLVRFVASGLAKGVDALAHKAALFNQGKTIAVIGNGLNFSYPMQNFALQEEIVQKGLLISEYLPGTPPRPYRFPERNRILAGLSQSVIVTEAKEKSGSLITANLALQENRDILCSTWTNY